ncbi:PREDICTED: uncharacterized protein LOC109215104 [Nicotiana attenuata]|uniref:uncharacterized protein LOC109215104 n=1 Tax=Nicotiana attenuata TaxID=49451 RepID=UPI000904DCC4|nr:PREDICTED: uncharacterized protein LOC109215104 [Nicotiana attenuata]
MGRCFPFALWSIWKNRNENNVNNTNLTINTTKVFQQTLKYHLLTSKHTTSNIPIKVKVKWHPPPRNWYKVNFDGAFKNESLHGGISGIIRNNKGEWMLGYYEKCQIISPIHAELLALRQALQTIIREKFTPCELETDATEVIHFLEEDYPTYSNLIYECRCLMGKAMEQGEIIMKHNFREGNMVAHKMAKEALKYPSYNITLYFAKPPNFAIDVYCKDQEGSEADTSGCQTGARP